MSYYTQNPSAMSADLKATAHRVRALHEKKGKDRPLVELDGHRVIPAITRRGRHRFCWTRPVGYSDLGRGSKALDL